MNSNMSVAEDWVTATLEYLSRDGLWETVEFKYNILTREVHAPGVVPFDAYSFADAKRTLYGVMVAP